MHHNDQVLHDLLCDTLRETHFESQSKMPKDFNYRLGVALHNLPHDLRESGSMPLETCLAINELDPTAKQGEWGQWVTRALTTLNQDTKYPF